MKKYNAIIAAFALTLIFMFNLCSPKQWSVGESETETDEGLIIKDSVGNLLTDGDTVTVIKDLKVKGSSSVVKVGTKVKNIRLVEGDHDIDCKVPGIGSMGLKSQFVRKG